MLTQDFIDKLSDENPDLVLTHRNLVENPVDHYDARFMEALWTEEQDRTGEMNQLIQEKMKVIEELHTHDYIIFSMPMYNFNVPSTFKAYIDNIIFPGITFQYTQSGGVEGLITNKKTMVISTRGGFYTGDADWKMYNFFEPYLTSILGLIGLRDIEFVIAEGLDQSSSDDQAQILANTSSHLEEQAGSWIPSLEARS